MNGPDGDVRGLLGWGELDADGLRGGGLGTRRFAASWTELEAEPPGGPRVFRTLFGRRDPTFRRIDAMSRALVLAVEATGIREALPQEARTDTALVVQTRVGCLDADLRFARTLDDEIVDGPLFAYTLPSTSLGEVALRHGLRGPSLCLSVEGAAGEDAWHEVLAMLEQGECSHAVVAQVDVQLQQHADVDVVCTARAVLVDGHAAGCDRWLVGG